MILSLLQIVPTHDQLQVFKDWGFPVFLVALPWLYSRLVQSIKNGVHSVVGPELNFIKEAILKELRDHIIEDREVAKENRQEFKEVKLAINLAQSNRINHLEALIQPAKETGS